MFSRIVSLALVCGLLALAAVQLPLTAAPGDAGSAEEVLVITPEREAEALKFAKLHHPELAKLLGQLKEGNPGGYEQGVRDLFKTSERLARVQARTPDRYESDLATWKLDSRIRLLAARTAMGDSDETRAKLKDLLLQKSDEQLKLWKNERERLTARIEKLDASIQNLTSNRDEAAEKELDRLLNSARSRAPQKGERAAKPEPRQAAKTNAPAKGAGAKAETTATKNKKPATKKSPQ